MSDQINPITGLADGWNSKLGCPIVHHRNLGRLRLARQGFAENHVRLSSARRLCFVNRLSRSSTLIVAFHGANMRNKPIIYPRYERIRTLLQQRAAFMSIADPTIERRPNVLLSWYLGDRSFDPIDAIDVAVDEATRRVGAKRVIFVGGSGGGYAAMRAMLRRPGSAAFVESPRFDLTKAIPNSVKNYLDTFWNGATLDSLIEELPNRFNLPRILASDFTDQHLYYLQGLFDPDFLWNNYRPAKRILGLHEASGTTPDGRATFALFESPEPRHGPPPHAVFVEHWNRAMAQFETTDASF